MSKDTGDSLVVGVKKQHPDCTKWLQDLCFPLISLSLMLQDPSSQPLLPWPFISVLTGLTASTCTLCIYFDKGLSWASKAWLAPAHGSWEVLRNSLPKGAVPKRWLTGVCQAPSPLGGKGKVHIYMGFQRPLAGLSSVAWWYSLTVCLLFLSSCSYSPTLRHLDNILPTLKSLSLSLLLEKPNLKTTCIGDDNLMLHLIEVLLSPGSSKAFLWNCVSV